MKGIKLALDNLNIKPNSEIKGHITVDYPGAYDGIVINTLIMNSNELIVYKSYNDEKISDNVSRLFISKDVMPDNKARFTAVNMYRKMCERENINFKKNSIVDNLGIALEEPYDDVRTKYNKKK